MKKIKRNFLFASLGIFTLTMGVLTSVTTSAYLSEIDAVNTYSMSITRQNGAVSGSYSDTERTVSAKTKTGNTVEFGYVQAMDNKNDQAQLKSKKGYFYNLSAITNIKKITVTYTNASGIKVAVGKTSRPTNYQESTSTTAVFEYDGVDDYYFQIYASSGALFIESIDIEYSCTTYLDGSAAPDPLPDTSSSETSTDSNPETGDGSVTIEGYDKPTSALTGYYQSIDINSTGAALLSDVRELTVSTHTTYTSYKQCTGSDNDGYYHQTDVDPNNPKNLIMFYTHASINAPWTTPAGNGEIYNREHVWPQSLSNNNWGTSGGGSDLHHLRPSFKPVNGERGNQLYGETNGTMFTYEYEGVTYDCGWEDGKVWEPLDNVKGDVARIIMYDFIHYNNPSNLEANDNLTGKITSTANSKTSNNSMPLTNVIDGTTNEAFALMLKWHKLDKVDANEIARNNAVYKIQGNRNPFIDQPWIMDAIWA